ncbi:hypothetical protein [Prauserella endophytica]|uniref:hypothetical protein n=1 Tax=Prauserella endophytica TaxID=1592324 RepID=UPI0010BEACB9|nr:hypothetical protein [Prauserella endophytica]
MNGPWCSRDPGAEAGGDRLGRPQPLAHPTGTAPRRAILDRQDKGGQLTDAGWLERVLDTTYASCSVARTVT